MWLSPHTMRAAGQSKALLGADDVHDALALVVFVKIFEPENLGALGQEGDLRHALRVFLRQMAVGGLHVVVDDAQRLFRRMHLALMQQQAFERLRAGHLVHQMAVDIDETGAVRLLVHQMVVPDLVVEGTRFHDS